MATDLTGLKVKDTYNSLLKIGDNSSLSATPDKISDGLGNESILYLSTSQVSIGTLPATGYDLTVNSATKTGSIDIVGAATAASLRLTGGSGSQGTLSWNTDEETVDIIQNGAVLQLGQEIHVHVKNQTGSTINDGTPVYVTGTLGASGRLTVAPMIADGSIEAKYFLGVTTEDIPNGEDGKVTTFGKIRGLNTSAYSEGQTLYVSASTAGYWQTTRPAAPNLDLEVAIVINSHANNGTIFVRAQQGHYLGMLHDVYISSPANNQFLVYNSTTSRWENQGIASVGSINLDSVTDNGNTTTNDINVGDITAGNMTLSGYLRGAGTFVIDPSPYADDAGVVQILGDLRVDGTTTTINSTTVTIDDKNIVLASGSATAADANGAGLTIDGADATMAYNSTSDTFDFNKPFNLNTGGQNIGITINSTDAGSYIYFKDSNATDYYLGADNGIFKVIDSGNSPILQINSSKDATFYGDISLSGNIQSLSQIRAIGWYDTETGSEGDLAFEIGASNGEAYALAYNRNTATYGDMNFAAVNFNFDERGGTTTIENNEIWHAGNDGAGSGLDADTVDTLHANQFLRSDVNDNKSGYILFENTGTATINTNYSSYPLIFRSSGWDTNNAVARTVDWNIRAEATSSVYPDGDLVFYEEQTSYSHYKLRLHGRGSGSAYQDPDSATFYGNVYVNQTTDATGGNFIVTGNLTASLGSFTNASSTVDSIRLYNTDDNYSYLRQTSDGNSNNLWIDSPLGATTIINWDNPGQDRTAGVYSSFLVGSGRGTSAESVRINRGNIYGKDSAQVEKYKISPDGVSYFNGGYVGIGLSPSYALDVASGANETARFTSPIGGVIIRGTSVNGFPGLLLQEGSTNKWNIRHNNAGEKLYFYDYTANLEVFALQNNGDTVFTPANDFVIQDAILVNKTNPTTHSNYNWYSYDDNSNTVNVFDINSLYFKRLTTGNGYDEWVYYPETVGLNFDISFKLTLTQNANYRHFGIAIASDGTNTTSNFDYIVLRDNVTDANLRQVRIDVAGVSESSLVSSSLPSFADGTERHILIQVRGRRYVIEVDGVVVHNFYASARTSDRGKVGFCIYEGNEDDNYAYIRQFRIKQYSDNRTIIGGLLGVNTQNPQEELDVNGAILATDIRVESGSSNSIRIGDGFGSGGSATIHNYQKELYLQYNNGSASGTSAEVRIGGGGTVSDLNMYGGGSIRMQSTLVIDSNRNIFANDVTGNDINGTFGNFGDVFLTNVTGASLAFRNSQGNTVDTDNLATVSFQGYYDSAFVGASRIQVKANEDFSTTARGTVINFDFWDTGSTYNTVASIDSSGIYVGTTNLYDNLPTGISWSKTDNRFKIGVTTNGGGTTETAIDDLVLATSINADYIPYVSSAGGDGDTVNAILSQSWLKFNSDTLEVGNVSDPFSVDSKIIKISRQIAPNEKQITEFKAQGIFVTSTSATYGTKNSSLQFYTNGRLNINGAYTLPEGDGTSGQVLYTDGSGVMGWTDALTLAAADARYAPKSAYDVYGTGYGWLMNDYDGSSNKLRMYYNDDDKTMRFYSYHGATGDAHIGLYHGSGFVTFGGDDINNWNTAYGWGNHATANYLKNNAANTITDSCYFIGSPSYGFRFNSNDDAYNNVIMYDNGDMYVRGELGIGTNTPDCKLSVATTDQLIARFASTNTGLTGLRIQGVDSSASDTVYVDWVYDAENRRYGFGEGTSGGTLPITSGLGQCDFVVDSGKIGIGGIDNPDKQLTFNQVADDAIQIRRVTTSEGNPAVGTGISWTWESATTYDQTWAAIRAIMPGSGNSHLTFSTSSGSGQNGLREVMRVTDSGRVGVMSDNPSATLQTNGTFRATGHSYFDYRVTIGGTSNAWTSLLLPNGTGDGGANAGVAIAFEGTDYAEMGYRLKANGANYYQVLYNGSAINWKHYTGAAYTPRMTLTNSGNLGLNASSPLGGTNNLGMQIDHGGHTTLLLGDGVNDGGVLQSSDNGRRMFMGANVYDDVSGSWTKFKSTSGAAAFDAMGFDANGLARIVVTDSNDAPYIGANVFFEALNSTTNSYVTLKTKGGTGLTLDNSARVTVNDLAVESGASNSIRIGDAFGSGGSATIHNYQKDLYLQYNNGLTSTNLYLGGGGTQCDLNLTQGFGRILMNRNGKSGSAIDLQHVEDGTWPFIFYSSSVGNDNPSGFWVNGDGTPDMRLRAFDSTVKALIHSNGDSFINGGKLGVGLTNPSARLHIDAVSYETAFNIEGGAYAGIGTITMGYYVGGLTFDNTGFDGTKVIVIDNDGTQVGYIASNATSTTYSTTSDYRLKENIAPINDGIDRLKQLKPSRFNFIGHEEVVDGFIAHEAQAVVPEAVNGEKDGVDFEGNPEYQGIDTSKLVPLLTAALQEAVAKIEALEQRILTLENK